jgi:hypothetical protein
MRIFRKLFPLLFVVILAALGLATPSVSANTKLPMKPFGSDDTSSCDASKPHDLVLLIDQSFSLTDEIEKGQTKQEKLIEALTNLNSQLFQRDSGQGNDLNSQNNVAIIQFAGDVEVLRDLNEGPLQPGEFQAIADQLTRNSNSLQGGTNYLGAIEIAIKQLTNSKSDDTCQSIVWFTDGQLNLGTGSPLDEADRLTRDFCGAPGSNATSTAQLLREENIQTYVIFLAKQADLPKRRLKPESAKEKKDQESIGFFDSIESLRAITGDWNDEVKGQNVAKEAVNSQCGAFNDNLGELIFVEKSEDLIYQLLVGASDCISTSQSLKMPSARLIKKLVVYFQGVATSGSLIEAPPSLVRNAPPEGSKIVLGQDDLKSADGAPFPAGWQIQFGADFQTCIGLEWEPQALQITGIPVYSTYSALETEPIQINLDLEQFSADVEDISDTEAIVGSAATVSGTNQIEFRPTSNAKEILQMPGQVRLIPKGVDQAVTDKLRTKPILATVKLSEPVVVTGAEDVPDLKCGEVSAAEGENLSLTIRHVDGELSDEILSSNQKCVISNLKTGVIEVRWKKEPKAGLSKDGRWVMRSGDRQENQALTFDSAEADSQDFDVAFSEAVDGEYIPQSDHSAVLEVQWLNNDATLITWKIDVDIDVDLKKPADRMKATLFALLISLIAGLLSYLLLYFILWKTAIVGKPGHVRYRVERRTVGKYFSSKDIEIDSSVVTSLKPTSGDNLSRSLSAGEVQLSVRVAPVFRPLKVLRGAWAEVFLQGVNIAVRPRGPQPSSTIAPLRPAVIARLVSFQIESDKYEIEYTFLLPNGNADLVALVNSQRDVTKEVIDKAGLPSISKEPSTGRSASRTEKVDGNQESTKQPLPPLPSNSGNNFKN